MTVKNYCNDNDVKNELILFMANSGSTENIIARVLILSDYKKFAERV